MDKFTPDNLIVALDTTLQTLPDKRKGANTQYAIADAAKGAFAIFFTQHPSFLSYQRQMEATIGKSNANSLIKIRAIPDDRQIKRLLDEISPDRFAPVFTDCLKKLKETEGLKQFETELGYLIALDGTQTVSSKTIHCSKCLTKTYKNETKKPTTYYHSALTPVIVKPEEPHVLSLMPEYISNTDGTTKQDCENAAAKRCLNTYGDQYKSLGEVTILGDDLYSRQPVVQTILGKGLHFILVCKRESHKTLYDYIDLLNEGDGSDDIRKTTTRERFKDSHILTTYRFMNNVPLRDGSEALLVNWVEITQIVEKTGEQMYHNAFITDHNVAFSNVALIASCGRTRWKIENEGNNTLKTQGYHFEHNYGHGEKYLANTLATLILLAFLFHTILDLFFEPFVFLKKALTRRVFFDSIRILTNFFYCFSWEHLFSSMRHGLQKGLPLPTGDYILPSG
jgi:hypothetical protein